MPLYAWPTDPPGRKAAHTITWQQHQAHLKGQPGNLGRGGLLLAPTATQATAPAPAVTPALTPAPATPKPALAEFLAADPTYLAALGANAAGAKADIGELQGERARTAQDYGYTEGPVDPTTGQPSLILDVSDPFSKAAELKRSYDLNRRGVAGRMGAAGLMTQGTFQTNQDFINRAQLTDENRMTKALQDFLARNTGGQTKVSTGAQMADATALGDATGRFSTNPLYQP